MNKTAREFIILAYRAMQKAYEYESEGMTNCDKESAKEVGNALQMIGDLSRAE